jgi:hypothetical protein
MAKVILCPVPRQVLKDMSDGMVEDVPDREPLLPVPLAVFLGTNSHSQGNPC